MGIPSLSNEIASQFQEQENYSLRGPWMACGGGFYPPRAGQLNPGSLPGYFGLGRLVFQRRVGSLGLSFSRTLGFVLVLFFGLVAVPDRASGLVHEVTEGRKY